MRGVWGAGGEVDTFHTFHWGERGADGAWRADPAHVPDIRALLAESAARQGVEFPAVPAAWDEGPTPLALAVPPAL